MATAVGSERNRVEKKEEEGSGAGERMKRSVAMVKEKPCYTLVNAAAAVEAGEGAVVAVRGRVAKHMPPPCLCLLPPEPANQL